MKQEYIKKRHSCVLLPLEDFRQLLRKLYPGETIYVDAALDGLYVGLSDDDLPAEDLHDRLAKELGVDQVTSIHIDDYEPCGVWIVYKDYDMLYRSDFVAAKLWSREDIESMLIDEDFRGTEKEIDEVIGTGYLKALEECSDNEWDIIKDAIHEAVRCGKISPLENS